MTKKMHVQAALLVACFLQVGGGAAAAGLQVAPISLSLRPSQNADGLWLRNTADSVVRAQVRVYRWTQEAGEEKLVPSRGLVVSPPMLQIAPGGKQLVRVIRVGAPPNGPGALEDAYRLSIDELPIDGAGKKGLQFVLRYSVPIFVEPVGRTPGPPRLSWALRREGEQAVLEVVNSGGTHAQLAGLSYVDAAGQRTEIAAGLLGYVLPGATMRWTLKSPAVTFVAGGTVEGKINGEAATESIALDGQPR